MAYDDDEGEWVTIVIGAVVGGLVSGLMTYAETGDTQAAVDAGIAGAIVGGLCGAGFVGVIWGSIISGVYTATKTEGDYATKAIAGGLSALNTFIWAGTGAGLTEEVAKMGNRILATTVFDFSYGVAACASNKCITTAVSNWGNSRTSNKSTGTPVKACNAKTFVNRNRSTRSSGGKMVMMAK